MTTPESSQAELLALVRALRRARKAFINAAQALPPASLDEAAGESGWTARRLIQYCGACERYHMTRVYNFFDPEMKPYEGESASPDQLEAAHPDRTLAREIADVWLAGRETEMWLDLIENENLDAIRHATSAWPEGGWTIREIFGRLTGVYCEHLGAIRSRGDD